MANSRPRHFLSNLQRSVPPLVIVVGATACILMALALLIFPFKSTLPSIIRFFDTIPSWVLALSGAGLFVVVIIGGVILPRAYSAFESFVLLLAFGNSPLRDDFQRQARKDFDSLVDALDHDFRFKMFAPFFAMGRSYVGLCESIRRFRNRELHRMPGYYRQTIKKLKDGWQRGVSSTILLRHVDILQRLLPPSPEEGVLGQAVAANITYLSGDLKKGRRLADRTLADAEVCDGSGLPVYQWLASYAHANSRLFLGQFDDGASSLGKRWRTKYVSLPLHEKSKLFSELKHLSTVHPIASVPRHIILASAFAGLTLRNADTQPQAPPAPPLEDDKEWASYWYQTGQEVCDDEPISLHFTHAYMSLYCLVVQPLEEPQLILERIPENAPPVSKYVKDGMLGLYYLREDRFAEAMEAFGSAYTYGQHSGNKFLDAIFLPAHATAALHESGPSDPEAREVSSRARARAKSAQSAFYDSLVDAYEAVLAFKENKIDKFQRLRKRAEWQPGGLVKIYGLDRLVK